MDADDGHAGVGHGDDDAVKYGNCDQPPAGYGRAGDGEDLRDDEGVGDTSADEERRAVVDDKVDACELLESLE